MHVTPNTSALAGYLPCNGNSYTSTAYPALYTVLGGTGGTFNTPNFGGLWPQGTTSSSTL